LLPFSEKLRKEMPKKKERKKNLWNVVVVHQAFMKFKTTKSAKLS
jgi:hypothetical protein